MNRNTTNNTDIQSTNSIGINATTNENLSNNQNVISPDRYVFWMNDICILTRNEGYIKFVPTGDMTRIEQLNAFTRFFIYLIIILFMFDKTDDFIYVPIIGIIMVIVLYNVFEADVGGKREELLRMKRKKDTKDVQKSDLNYRTYQVNDNGQIITIDIDQEEAQKFKDASESDASNSIDYDLESGYYDSNGKLQTGQFNDATRSLKQQNNKKDIKYSLDEMRLYDMHKCRKPSVDNPFMNPSVDDFNKDDVPVACNADEEDIKKEIDLKFNADLYRDVEDVFDKKNSQRQFYTIAHNAPNDQEAFARWCYKFPTTCKTNQERCLRYEDLQTKYHQ
jgi:hypothetical protein